MDYLRENGKELFDGIENVFDYSKGIDGLPKENVLKFVFENGTWFAARPSGTEPKLKIYYSVCEANREKAFTALEALRRKLKETIGV
jgi:phosphoglucomutase